MHKNLVIRWTFGENKARPISLQSYDMLHCSVLFARRLFKNARLVLCQNNLSRYSEKKIKSLLDHEIEIIDCKNEHFNSENKNSFWKYIPARIDNNSWELLLDSDIVLWKIPETILNWIGSDKLLLNSDWNGSNYGYYENANLPLGLNAGVIGFPPTYVVDLPNFEGFKDLFHSEQGFIVKSFTDSEKEVLTIPRTDIFQSNAKNYIHNPIKDLTDSFHGAHFCGCNYAHYQHWDKYYKDQVWDKYYGSI